MRSEEAADPGAGAEVLVRANALTQVDPHVAAAVDAAGLSDQRRTKLARLSGGMLRRAGIAQAIVNDPDLLILDEPTAGLDPEQRVQFRALVRRVGEHATVIIATHLVEDVAQACNAVLVMGQGRVVFRGTPPELAARGSADIVGDTPLERGYTTVLRGPEPSS